MAYVQKESPLLRVRKTTKGKGRNFRTASEGAGMTAAGVKKYRKQNPGSKLKTAVTKCDVKPGTKAYKRQKALNELMKGTKNQSNVVLAVLLLTT